MSKKEKSSAAMRVLWVVSFDNAETDVYLEKKSGNEYHVITAIHQSDARLPIDHFATLTAHFGFIVKQCADRETNPAAYDAARAAVERQGLGYLLGPDPAAKVAVRLRSTNIREENDG